MSSLGSSFINKSGTKKAAPKAPPPRKRPPPSPQNPPLAAINSGRQSQTPQASSIRSSSPSVRQVSIQRETPTLEAHRPLSSPQPDAATGNTITEDRNVAQASRSAVERAHTPQERHRDETLEVADGSPHATAPVNASSEPIEPPRKRRKVNEQPASDGTKDTEQVSRNADEHGDSTEQPTTVTSAVRGQTPRGNEQAMGPSDSLQQSGSHVAQVAETARAEEAPQHNHTIQKGQRQNDDNDNIVKKTPRQQSGQKKQSRRQSTAASEPSASSPLQKGRRSAKASQKDSTRPTPQAQGSPDQQHSRPKPTRASQKGRKAKQKDTTGHEPQANIPTVEPNPEQQQAPKQPRKPRKDKGIKRKKPAQEQQPNEEPAEVHHTENPWDQVMSTDDGEQAPTTAQEVRQRVKKAARARRQKGPAASRPSQQTSGETQAEPAQQEQAGAGGRRSTTRSKKRTLSQRAASQAEPAPSRRRQRSHESSDESEHEDHTIDTQKTMVWDLTMDKKRGKVSKLEKAMRNINWKEVKRKKEEEQLALLDSDNEKNDNAQRTDEVTEQLNRADEQAQEAADAPGMKLVNGQLVFDTSALAVDNTAEVHAQAEAAAAHVVNDGDYEESDLVNGINTATWINAHKRDKRERMPRVRGRWDVEATDKFYDAITMFGADFTIIQKMFPAKTRRQIKLKFVREERMDPQRIKEAMVGDKKIAMSLSQYARWIGKEESHFKDPKALDAELDAEREKQQKELEDEEKELQENLKRKKEKARERQKEKAEARRERTKKAKAKKAGAQAEEGEVETETVDAGSRAGTVEQADHEQEHVDIPRHGSSMLDDGTEMEGLEFDVSETIEA